MMKTSDDKATQTDYAKPKDPIEKEMGIDLTMEH